MQSTPVLPLTSRHAPAGPLSGREGTRSARVWIAAAALLAGVFAGAEWADRPPSPAPADAPAPEFSEARARPVLQHLAGEIGRRVMGTPARDSAAAYLVATLRAIPGVEVQVQDWAGAEASPWRPGTVELYHARNVLARIPGDSASAVLVSAHYDSPPESSGAGDNAVGVAAAVEIARALAAGPRSRHTVIFNFNDGEEQGLLGSDAFLNHPWARDVRAFVNLESAGPRGKAILFQAGPGNDWLTEEYARSAPRPYGTVLGQDIFQSGVIPSDTDFRVYRDQGRLRGLDVALYQDGYAYHTALDRVERVQPGSLQHLGENTLALVRELADGPLPGDVGGAPSVYYDLLGRTMFAYSAGTAALLTVVALLLAVGALVLALRRTPLTVKHAAAGLGITVLAALVGLLVPVAAAFLLGMVLGRPHGWFASPGLAWAAFGALALAGFLFVHGVWERRNEDDAAGEGTALATLAGSTLFWALLLVLFTAAGIGSAYIPLWWTIAGAAGLLAWTFLPRGKGVALAVAWLPPAILTAQVQLVLLKLFAPVAGRFPAAISFDPVIALLVALPAVWLAAAGVAVLHRAGRLRLAAGVLGGIGVVGLVALASSSPYSAARPKRLAVQHAVSDTASIVTVTGEDWISPVSALAEVEGPRFRPRGGALARPADRPALPAPAMSVDTLGSTAEGRTVRVRVGPGSYRTLSLRVPADRLAGWSLGDELPRLPAGERTYTARIHPPASGAGWEVILRLRGADPVEVNAVEVFAPARTPAIDQVVRGLPEWVTVATAVNRRTPMAL
ncbi:MAG TPA: M28 family metallopeptidase [Longimicrobiaceae bacterium]|nr:M28 family metallopeptidase [Longimicrobiaceae bacterium]